MGGRGVNLKLVGGSSRPGDQLAIAKYPPLPQLSEGVKFLKNNFRRRFVFLFQFRIFSGGSNGIKNDPPKCDTCHSDGAITRVKRRQKMANFDLNGFFFFSSSPLVALKTRNMYLPPEFKFLLGHSNSGG